MHKMTHATSGHPGEWKSYEFPADAGEQLPNGAFILDELVLIEGGRVGEEATMRESVILAFTPDAHQPFVSWRRGVSLSRTATGEIEVVDSTYWGNYYTNIMQAVAGFSKRVKESRRQIHDGVTARV